MKEACANCRFWDVYEAGSAYYDKVGEVDVGECRRRAPCISDELLRRTMPWPGCDQFESLANILYLPSAFPVTHEGSWCGEYEPQRVGA